MTELSYTAWDDNKYQWPPPEGWYQASDGKWWPEGYGPVANQPTGADSSASVPSDDETATADEHHDESDEMVDDDDEMVVDEMVAEEMVADQSDDHDQHDKRDEHDEVAIGETVGDDTATGDEATDDIASQVHDDDAPEVDSGWSVADSLDDVGENHDAGEVVDAETSDDVGENHEIVTGEGDVSEMASGYDSEADTSHIASTAGMAASGFASGDESDSSSIGLAGWAQSGASDVRSRVDLGHEHDYGGSEDEPQDLIDPVDEPATGLDAPTEPVDSTLSRLDDLKRQVEQQSFTAPSVSSGTDDATLVSEHGFAGLDPTETLDIDPSDLAVDSNPYYGQADHFDEGDDSFSVASAAAAVTSPDLPGSTGNGWEVDTAAPAEHQFDNGSDHGFSGQPAEVSDYGFDSPSDARADVPPLSDSPAAEYGSGVVDTMSDTMSDQHAGGDTFGGPQVGYGAGSVLTPMSSPTPKPGVGRLILYGVIGLLAIGLAVVAGYLVFQLQSDGDAEVETTDNATEDAGSSEASSSADPSSQQPGSFSNPHQLSGGVRLTVQTDDGDEVWMLQVREPASTSDMGDDQVELTSRIRVRNDSTEGERSADGLRFVLVPADGSTATAASSSCSAGDDLDLSADIDPGTDVEGNVCFTVPAGQADSALLGVQSVHARGTVHVQLS